MLFIQSTLLSYLSHFKTANRWFRLIFWDAGRRGMRCRWERPRTGAVQTSRHSGGLMKGSLLTEKRKTAGVPTGLLTGAQSLLLYAMYSSPFWDGGGRSSEMLVFIYQSAWCQILDVSKRLNSIKVQPRIKN